jgi:hypothetical protein
MDVLPTRAGQPDLCVWTNLDFLKDHPYCGDQVSDEAAAFDALNGYCPEGLKEIPGSLIS